MTSSGMRREAAAAGPGAWLRRLRSAIRAAVRGYGRHGVSQQAAAIAFRVLFSLVPFVALTVAVIDLVLPESRREEVVDWVIGSLSGSTGLEESVRRAVGPGSTTASLAGLAALGGLIWGASSMMGAIRGAFRAIFETELPRSMVHGKAVDLAVAAGAGVAVIGALGLGIVAKAVYQVGSSVGGAVGVESAGDWIATAMSSGATLALVFAAFAGLYLTLPASRPAWAAVWPGALIGAVVFQVATTAYGAYLSSVGDLSVVYGSLGAVLGFLLVVWAGAIALLVGAEIVAGWPGSGHEPGRDRSA